MNDAGPTGLKGHRLGVAAALAAFTFGGAMPIYFKALDNVGAWEIISHRIIWAVPVLAVFLWYRDGRRLLGRLRLPPRLMAGLFLSSLLLSANWLVFIWAVFHDQVLSTSLGYFINPLFNVLLGFLFLRERFTTYQTIAIFVAAAGTVYLGWFLGRPPWIALTLATLFGCYGLVRKRLDVRPMTGLMWEVLLLMPVAAAYLVWRYREGRMDFLHIDVNIDALLLVSGLVTVLPLIWFNTAAQKLSLSTLGYFQYITPSIAFGLAVFLWDEPFTTGHAVAFGCIWSALALISLEQVRVMRRERRRLDSPNV